MPARAPSDAQIAAMRADGDVPGLLRAYAGTQRRDKRKLILQALDEQCRRGRDQLLDLLGDEELRQTAGAALVELGEDLFPAVAAQLDDNDGPHRRGSLHTVYLYARYRDMPAAQALLGQVAAGERCPDLAEAAAAMAAKVDQLSAVRNQEIDKNLGLIKRSIDREKVDGGSVVARLYSSVHARRMEGMQKITAMRYASVRHVVAVLPDYDEAAVGVLLALGLQEIGAGVVPMIEESLRSGDKRRRGLLISTLLCLQHARVPGAAEALERDGVKVTENMERRAAQHYRRWVKQK
jgi:hypothetical protein